MKFSPGSLHRRKAIIDIGFRTGCGSSLLVSPIERGEKIGLDNIRISAFQCFSISVFSIIFPK
jgi:hypothetical protein